MSTVEDYTKYKNLGKSTALYFMMHQFRVVSMDILWPETILPYARGGLGELRNKREGSACCSSLWFKAFFNSIVGKNFNVLPQNWLRELYLLFYLRFATMFPKTVMV